MTIEMKKVWFDGEKVVTQNIIESDIYKRHWDIASCKAYAEQLRDKKRANTAEHAAEAIEYLLALAQPKEPEPIKYWIASNNAICALLRQAHDALALTSYPLQRTWVGLTDEEAMQICIDCGCMSEDWLMLLDAIEAKLKQKNTRGQE